MLGEQALELLLNGPLVVRVRVEVLRDRQREVEPSNPERGLTEHPNRALRVATRPLGPSPDVLTRNPLVERQKDLD